MRWVASAVMATLASIALTGTPAAAQEATADLAVELASAKVVLATVNPNSGLFKGDTGIGYATVRVTRHNYGPNNTTQTTVVEDITAPPGTVFRQLDEKYFARYPGLCTVVVPHTRVRCKIDGSIWLDTYNGGSGGYTGTYYFVLKKKCVSPGRLRLDYAGDPKTSNNSITIRLKVPGVTAADCTKAKPSPTRTNAALAASALPSQPASTVSPSPVVASESSASPSASESAATAIVTASHGSASGSAVILGVVGVLAGAALLIGLWVRARRRPAETVG
jgi:hypothetical protein